MPTYFKLSDLEKSIIQDNILPGIKDEHAFDLDEIIQNAVYDYEIRNQVGQSDNSELSERTLSNITSFLKSEKIVRPLIDGGYKPTEAAFKMKQKGVKAYFETVPNVSKEILRFLDENGIRYRNKNLLKLIEVDTNVFVRSLQYLIDEKLVDYEHMADGLILEGYSTINSKGTKSLYGEDKITFMQDNRNFSKTEQNVNIQGANYGSIHSPNAETRTKIKDSHNIQKEKKSGILSRLKSIGSFFVKLFTGTAVFAIIYFSRSRHEVKHVANDVSYYAEKSSLNDAK